MMTSYYHHDSGSDGHCRGSVDPLSLSLSPSILIFLWHASGLSLLVYRGWSSVLLYWVLTILLYCFDTCTIKISQTVTCTLQALHAHLYLPVPSTTTGTTGIKISIFSQYYSCWLWDQFPGSISVLPPMMAF